MTIHQRELHTDLLTRYEQNPILTARDWPYFVNTIFNAAAERDRDGGTVLLCRVEDGEGRSHLSTARSSNGVTDWRVDPRPSLVPDDINHPEEQWGIEDARTVWMADLDRYAVTYTCYGPSGPGVSLALTADFERFERIGCIMPPENKDAALLPRKIDGRFALIHRPVSVIGGAHMWISFSTDLRHWGDHALLMSPRQGPWWDAGKIGLSPPPIETAEGWLVFYHGVRDTPAGCIYRVGLALLDLEDPRRCLCRSSNWVLSPEADYERTGDVGNVVFPCGYTLEDDRDTIHLYYGAADTSIAMATGRISALLAWLHDNSRPGDAARHVP